MKELFYGTTNCKKDYVDYMKIILWKLIVTLSEKAFDAWPITTLFLFWASLTQTVIHFPCPPLLFLCFQKTFYCLGFFFFLFALLDTLKIIKVPFYFSCC